MINQNVNYNSIIEDTEYTVVSEYTSTTDYEITYQSEAQLEKDFIKQLQSQGYEYLSIKSEEELISNLREQLEKLNKIKFSDDEWKRFSEKEIINANLGILEKTVMIQEDHVKTLKRDDNTDKNILLIDKSNIHNNSLQVINQFENSEGNFDNRYDVTILVNGFPLVHVELKRRGVALREAFNQINRYQNDSFWAGTGLFQFVQIFVISNGTHTKYYSNTTRYRHLKETNLSKSKSSKKSSNSFEFTSWWADANNKIIPDLIDFTKTFFTKHTLLNLLTKFCVFTTESSLMVMRPYQIIATEKILKKIEISTNYKKLGTVEAGGYIWHTTGSGKTLTSFKTAQLVSKLPNVDKVLFVVDRKDLDYQTMLEFNKFAEGSVNATRNTKLLSEQFTKPNGAQLSIGKENKKLICTTIQKLEKFVSSNKGHNIFSKHIVIIFDECHRSQFGQMHLAITKSFKNYNIFGFTGTPIFAANSSASGNIKLRTTEQAFGEKLHHYTIVDAINDRNVLPFKVDYHQTFREKENISDQKISDIDREKALEEPERIALISKYILDNFDIKTKRNSTYKLKDKRVSGFNSIFAVSSIQFAKLYYAEFQKQIAQLPSDKRLKIATIFSFGMNDEDQDGMIDENPDDTSALDIKDREFLGNAIKDYNMHFGTSFDTSSDKFQNYYKDISQRMKSREIDLLIVVNMFLTGFDATTLNTLWVDKNLRMHGLLQAFSRTNRILNSIKTHGNIVCFRNLSEATDEAIALFGNKDAKGIVLIKTYNEYYYGEKDQTETERGYLHKVAELQSKFPVGTQIVGEQNQKGFVKLYGEILKLRNILNTFDEFSGNEILNERKVQDYHSMYIDLYNVFRKKEEGEKVIINDDLVFEIELIKQVEINIDYILALVKKYHEKQSTDKELLSEISRVIDSSIDLRNKKDLILNFVNSINKDSDIDKDWSTFISKTKSEELNKIINEENLKPEETYKFIQKSFEVGGIITTGTDIMKIMPPISRFAKDNSGSKKKNSVINRLKEYFVRFFGIYNNTD